MLCPRTAHCHREKKALCANAQRANVSRYHLILQVYSLNRISKYLFINRSCISFFCNGKSRNNLRTIYNPATQFIALSTSGCTTICAIRNHRFSHSVQKLPSVPAIPDRLSAGEPSSLLVRNTYSSFSIPFPIFVILAKGGRFVKMIFKHSMAISAADLILCILLLLFHQ